MTRSNPPNGSDATDLLDILGEGHPPAFATDARQIITFWNRGAARVFGREPHEALGRHCHDVVCGKDGYGNRYCNDHCPIYATVRRGEPVSGCQLLVHSKTGEASVLAVTVLQLPGRTPNLFSLVHLIQSLDESTAIVKTASRLNAYRLEGPLPSLEAAASPLPPLTTREKEILRWVASGLQNKEIAEKLEISLATVRNHIHHVLEKLGVHSKLEAVSLAFRSGWIGDDGASRAIDAPEVTGPRVRLVVGSGVRR